MRQMSCIGKYFGREKGKRWLCGVLMFNVVDFILLLCTCTGWLIDVTSGRGLGSSGVSAKRAVGV